MNSSKKSQHFSHKFEFNFEQLPARKSDRMALRITYPSMFLGLVLAALGIYEYFMRFKKTNIHFDTEVNLTGALSSSWISPNLFDIVIILLGLGIIISTFLSYIRYKKIFFDGKAFEVIYRPIWGAKKKFREPLDNYEGVQLRIEFFQFGFINRNKYIIELHNNNSKKSIPLYINTNGKGIYQKLKNYSKILNKPMIFVTEKGKVLRDIENIDKPLTELVRLGIVDEAFNEKAPIPSNIDYTRKGDKTIIKVRKLLWDAYNIIAWFGILVFGGVIVSVLHYHSFWAQRLSEAALIWFYIIAVAGLMASAFLLFRKDKIVIKPHKVIVVHKFMLFSRKKDEILKEDIEAIIINVVPSTERHYLAIIADEKTIVFGKKLSVKDLNWVKGFLIKEIVR